MKMGRALQICSRLLRKAARSVALLLLVLTVTFAMVRTVPGGPFDGERELTPQARLAIESYYGTDRSAVRSYFSYLGNALRGDLGPSYRQLGWSVRELISDKMKASLELGTYALLLAIAIGVPIGSMAALHPQRFPSKLAMALAMIFICAPSFALGPILSCIFSGKLHWFRAMGWDSWRCKVLPTVTLGLFHAAFIARLTCKSMANEFSRPYVRTARAKGLSMGAVFRRHIFRNGIGSTIAYLGPTCAGVLSGTFAVESIFHIPGLGRLFIESMWNRDYGIVTGVVLTYAAMILCCNFFADAAIAIINPNRSAAH